MTEESQTLSVEDWAARQAVDETEDLEKAKRVYAATLEKGEVSDADAPWFDWAAKKLGRTPADVPADRAVVQRLAELERAAWNVESADAAREATAKAQAALDAFLGGEVGQLDLGGAHGVRPIVEAIEARYRDLKAAVSKAHEPVRKREVAQREAQKLRREHNWLPSR